MTRRKIYPILAAVGIAVAAGGAWWYQSKLTTAKEITALSGPSGAANPASAASAPGGAASAPRAAGVEVAKVEKSSLQDDAQSVGSLRSVQSVMLRPEVPGRVKALGFADGAPVRKGQLLVQLDDTLQRAEVKQSLAQVSIVKANLKRNQELVAQNFVAQRVVDESSASLQVADAQLAPWVFATSILATSSRMGQTWSTLKTTAACMSTFACPSASRASSSCSKVWSLCSMPSRAGPSRRAFRPWIPCSMPTAVLSACALCCPILPVRLPRWDLVQVRLVHRVAQPLRVRLASQPLRVRLASQPMPPNPAGVQPVDKPVASRLQPKLLRQPQIKPWPVRLHLPCARLKC
jgi:hypothetical protein